MKVTKIALLLGAIVDVEWADTWAEKADPQEIRDLAADCSDDEVQSKALEVVAELADRADHDSAPCF